MSQKTLTLTSQVLAFATERKKFTSGEVVKAFPDRARAVVYNVIFKLLTRELIEVCGDAKHIRGGAKYYRATDTGIRYARAFIL